MKKFASIGMIAALTLALYGCSENEIENVGSAETTPQEQQTKEDTVSNTAFNDGVDEKNSKKH